jgi:S1-C subfamily serine protease
VQTTAPISPGSSGGGLFDAQGNLVGITTLVLTGRERLNQCLNLAIPADAYFRE